MAALKDSCNKGQDEALHKCQSFWATIHAPKGSKVAGPRPISALASQMKDAEEMCGSVFAEAEGYCRETHQSAFATCSSLANTMTGDNLDHELLQLKMGCEKGAKDVANLCEAKHKAAQDSCESSWKAAGAANKAGLSKPMAHTWDILMGRALRSCMTRRQRAYKLCQEGAHNAKAGCKEASDECSTAVIVSGDHCKRAHTSARQHCREIHKHAKAATDLLVQKVAAAASSMVTPKETPVMKGAFLDSEELALERSVQHVHKKWKKKAAAAVRAAALHVASKSRRQEMSIALAQRLTEESATRVAIALDKEAWKDELDAGAEAIAPTLDRIMEAGEAA